MPVRTTRGYAKRKTNNGWTNSLGLGPSVGNGATREQHRLEELREMRRRAEAVGVASPEPLPVDARPRRSGRLVLPINPNCVLAGPDRPEAPAP